ncbi:MAG: hydrolase [Acidobacteriia bacterium]|nr:hydrolase [Terriglobia bacterium]
MIEQYMALALQPTMRGCTKRSEVEVNIRHISDLIDASIWLSSIDLPVRLICIPEGCLQGFTDEVFDWDHEKYVEEMALDIPGPETEMLGRKAKQHNAFIIAQAKIKHPEFPRKFFNGAFIIAPTGEVIYKYHKLQVFAREHSTVPHDVWDKWVELYGDGLDSFFPVADTEIGRIGCVICMDGSFPETARGMAMNGAEVLYRPAYPEPYVANGLWEVQNRARALDNTCYVVAPNPANYYLMQDSKDALDTFGGKSMIVDYQGRVLSQHEYGAGPSYAGAIIDIEALRQYRTRSLWGNWLRDLRTEQFRCIYEKPLYPKNLGLKKHPGGHADHDAIRHRVLAEMVERGIYRRPTKTKAQPKTEEVPAD